MDLPNLIQPVYDEKAKAIKHYPCHVNRASSIGYFVPQLDGCLRRGYYERMNWQDKELPSVELAMIFDEGNLQERKILQDFAAAGVDILEQQTMYEWKEYQISGHIDGKILVDGVAVPVEIKSMSPNVINRINSFEDFRKFSWTQAYKAQINLYMLMQNIDYGIMILKNKSSGALKQINVQLDYEIGEACLKACETINRAIATKTPPDRIDNRKKCAECPFKTICHPGVDFGVPIKVSDDPRFNSKVREYLDGIQRKKEIEALYAEIKEQCKASAENGELNYLASSIHITGKLDARGSFRIKMEEVE